MKLRDLNPDIIYVPLREFLFFARDVINIVGWDGVIEYYEKNLPLWVVMNYCGIEDVDENTVEKQVPCSLFEHGTADMHSSARYFSYNRNTDEERPAVYCYKCNKILTSFWYLYNYEKDQNNLSFSDVLCLLETHFKIPFPRDLFLDFDYRERELLMDIFVEEENSLKTGFEVAKEILKIKETDPVRYGRELESFYLSL